MRNCFQMTAIYYVVNQITLKIFANTIVTPYMTKVLTQLWHHYSAENKVEKHPKYPVWQYVSHVKSGLHIKLCFNIGLYKCNLYYLDCSRHVKICSCSLNKI